MGPKASRRYTYVPPALGYMADSSAMLQARHKVMTPPVSQARAMAPTVPTPLAISAVTPKMPLPMMAPTTTAAAENTPRRRGSWSGVSDLESMRASRA